jgi:hypothetical protein
MRLGYSSSSEEFGPRELVRQARLVGDPVLQGQRPRAVLHQSSQLTSLSEVARHLLQGTQPLAEPMISRAGVRGEARWVRSTLRATMRDQQSIGGK